jgi:predicted metalloendopeptidase
VDFYQFACGGWRKAHPVKGNATRETKFNEPYYAAFPLLQKIIEDDFNGARDADDPHAALIGDYYGSCVHAPEDTSSRDVLGGLLAKIDAVTTLDDLARQVAAQRDVGSGSFFFFYVSPDPRDSTHYGAILNQGGYELADRSYYLDPEYKGVIADYKAHIEAMSLLIGGTPIDAAAVIRIETALAAAWIPQDELRDLASLYHPMTAAAAAALAPTFPWQVFWSEAGFPALTSVDVVAPSYLLGLETLIKSTPLEDLKSYLRWQLLQDHASGLGQAFIDEDFHFWRTFTGQAQQYPRWFTCYNKTLAALGEAVAQPYIARHYDEAASTATRAMFDREQRAFATRLENDAWLDPGTRSEALHKLDALVAKIGHPTKDPDFTGLVIDDASFLGNEIRLRQLGHARARGSARAWIARNGSFRP